MPSAMFKNGGDFNVSQTALFGVYISYVAYNMHGVMNPMRNAVIEPGAPMIKPLWDEGTKVRARDRRSRIKRFGYGAGATGCVQRVQGRWTCLEKTSCLILFVNFFFSPRPAPPPATPSLVRHPIVRCALCLFLCCFLPQMTATCYLAKSRKFKPSFLDRSSHDAARTPLVARCESSR